MECMCGYNDKNSMGICKPFIKLTDPIVTKEIKYISKVLYACPECGTVKIELKE